MKTRIAYMHFFACDFEDGGELYRLVVDIYIGQRQTYRCKLTSLDDLQYINKAGKLCQYTGDEVIIDLCRGSGGWIDAQCGHYALVDRLGSLIDKNTL